MVLIRLLVALHPRSWRDQYGEEFTALLEDSRLTRRAVANVVAHAARLQARAHLGALLVVVALVFSGVCEAVALRTGLTANILWAPTNPVRATALLLTLAPWLGLIVRARDSRHSPTLG
jgi:hypothetical protein